MAAAQTGEPIAVARAALRGELSAAQVRRLLRRPAVRAEVARMLQGWDGADDTLEIEEVPGGLRIHVILRKRELRCVMVGDKGEGQTPVEQCFEDLDVVDERTLDLDKRLWRRPPAKASVAQEAPPEPEGPAVDEPPEPEPPEPDGSDGDGPAMLSVMHARSFKADAVPLLVASDPVFIQLAAAHERFKLWARTSWVDPFRTSTDDLDPQLVQEAQDRRRPRPSPRMANSMGNAANPFDEARLGGRLDTPIPSWLVKTHIEPGPMGPSIDRPDHACTRDWEDRWDMDHAPGLGCFRSVERAARLDGAGYEVAGWLAQLLPSPFNLIPAAVAKDAMADAQSENVSGLIWAVAWLNWADVNRGALRPALDRLTLAERTELRRRVLRWWGGHGYERYQDVISQLYEEHLVQLYPGLAGSNGLPERALFRSDFLWGTNWVAELGATTDPDVVTALHDLKRDEKRIVASVAGLPRLAQRYPRVAAAARL